MRAIRPQLHNNNSLARLEYKADPENWEQNIAKLRDHGQQADIYLVIVRLPMPVPNHSNCSAPTDSLA
jgi:hypothetical protein